MRLLDIASITTGHPFRGSIPEKVGSSIRVVQLKDIEKSGNIGWGTTIEAELETKKEPDWLKSGDILFSARGNRNYAFLVGECPKHALAAPYFFVIKVKHSKLLPDFLAWQLNQSPSQRYFQKESEGSLTKSIRKNVLEAKAVIIPSLEKQKHIISIAGILEREKQICEQLILNGEALLSRIASRLEHEQN